MAAISFLLVGLNTRAGTVAREAATQALPAAVVTEFAAGDANLPEILEKDAGIILADPCAAHALALAAAARDADGLPRWSTIVLDDGAREGTGTVFLTESEWTGRTLVRVIASVLHTRSLQWENARLRGDLSTVARRINHDLRSPITAIQTSCDAINEVLAGQTDEHAPFTQSILTSTDELMQLVERVGFILKASSEPTPRESVPMGEIVFAAQQRLEQRLLRASASVAQPGRWPLVEGVAAWLEVVWHGLLSNALKHGGPAPQIQLGWSENEGEFRFWIEDGGPGIAEGCEGDLFFPFHRLHRLNAPRGLGLPIAQRLVELHGGRCGYAPRPGGGAHFFFTLPTVRG